MGLSISNPRRANTRCKDNSGREDGKGNCYFENDQLHELQILFYKI